MFAFIWSISGQQQQHHQSLTSGHAENRLSGSNTPLTPSTTAMEPRFPPTPGTTNPSGGISSGGAQAGSTFPIPSSPQTPTTGTSNPSSAPGNEKSFLWFYHFDSIVSFRCVFVFSWEKSTNGIIWPKSSRFSNTVT